MSPYGPSTHTKRGVRMYSALAVECNCNIRVMDDDQTSLLLRKSTGAAERQYILFSPNRVGYTNGKYLEK